MPEGLHGLLEFAAFASHRQAVYPMKAHIAQTLPDKQRDFDFEFLGLG